MDPYLKHTLFAMAVGYFISQNLALDFWPSVALGVILAVCAKVVSNWEERSAQLKKETDEDEV